MGYPSISQWIDTVSNPCGRFRTLGNFEPCRDAYGNVRFTAGNSAAVFPVVADGRRMMLKCFIKEGRCREVLYATTSGAGTLLSPTVFLPEEAYVYDEMGNGQYYDVAVGEWIEGNTLETELRRVAREFGAGRFAELAALFDRMAAELLSREWAHGDLKPDNIIITPEGKAVLIDYDAMYVPGGGPTGEAGTPGYQHPARTEDDYGKFIDDYPVALLSVSLHALAIKPELYQKYHKGDGLILVPDEICRGTSEAYGEILNVFADNGEYGLYDLANKLATPVPAIPGLSRLLASRTCPVPDDQNNGSPLLFGSGGLWGYAAQDSQEIVPAVFTEAFEYSEGLGVAHLRGKWHVVGANGKMIFNTGHLKTCPDDIMKPHTGQHMKGKTTTAAQVSVMSERASNRKAAKAASPPSDDMTNGEVDAMKPFGCGLAAFRRNGKWGYMDTRGTIVIEPVFDRAGTMHDGAAAVRLHGKYGFIDTAGQTIIPFEYDRARGFRDGTAEVEANGEIFRIDLSGKRV